ncbi:trypsin-like peptidase domain-containing protein [Lachnospiraceae bacterium 54-11]
MYENNYPNNYSNHTAEQNPVNNTTYHYESGGSFSGTNYSAGESKTAGFGGSAGGGNGKKGNKGGIGKKIAVAVCCGLFFGVFAGLGFQAIDTASDFFKIGSENAQSETDSEDQERAQIIDNQANDAGTVSYENLSDEQITEIQELISRQVSKATVTDVTEVVKEVMPAVVSVNNRYIERMSFLGQEFSQEAGGSGSGIIVGKNDEELLLVSNYHVVESAEELTVQFADGTQCGAQTKGFDEAKDLAVLAVPLSDISNDTMSKITIAKLGSSDDLTVGEPVIAIGNSLGYGQSVTTGVVSALDRVIGTSASTQSSQQTDTEVNTFIQTDAAINPGNSGGALINIKGEVIGINSNKIGGSAVEGMGYAIPISDAEPIIQKLMEKQTRSKVAESERGYLGITGLDVNQESASLYGLPLGAFVSNVVEGSAADKAGLVRGDIITAINGWEVKSMAELKEEISGYAAGETVELTIMQGSPDGYQTKTVEVTLGRAG